MYRIIVPSDLLVARNRGFLCTFKAMGTEQPLQHITRFLEGIVYEGRGQPLFQIL